MSTSRKNTKSSILPAAEPFTLPWTLDKYTDYLRTTRGLSKGFIGSSRHALRRFFTFLSEQGVKDIRQVSRKHVDAFQEALLESSLQTVTKRGLLFCLVSFFRYLFEFGYANEELHLVVEPPPKPHQIPRTILSQEEVRFLASLPNPHDLYEFQDLCLLTLLFASGMRPEEACVLMVEDVDLRRPNPHVIVRRPKNKMDRVVSIDQYTAGLLEKFMQTARPWMVRGKPTNRLFASAIGTPMTREGLERRFYKRYAPIFREKFGKEITLYSLRHSSATQWLDEGFRHDEDILPCVQRQLGHRRMDSTAVYTHVAIEPMREMLRRYHPRELAYADLRKVPESPEDLS